MSDLRACLKSQKCGPRNPFSPRKWVSGGLFKQALSHRGQRLAPGRRIEALIPRLVLLILVALGLYFRLTYWRQVSPLVDEFITMLAARGVLRHGLPLLPSGALYEQGLIFSYLEALTLGLLGFTEGVARLPSLAVSLLTIPLLYLVGRRMFSPAVGLVAAALLALAPEAIAWGGRARMYALLQLWVLLAVYFLHQGAIQGDRGRHRRWFALCYLGALFTHPVAVLLFPPFLLSVLPRRGLAWFRRPGVLAEYGAGGVGILATLVLKKIAQPGQLEALAQSRPYLQPTWDWVGGLRVLQPLFLTPQRLPLAALVLAGCWRAPSGQANTQPALPPVVGPWADAWGRASVLYDVARETWLPAKGRCLTSATTRVAAIRTSSGEGGSTRMRRSASP